MIYNTTESQKQKRLVLKLIFSSVSSVQFDIQATIECGFTLKPVRDMTRTYSHNNSLLINVNL